MLHVVAHCSKNWTSLNNWTSHKSAKYFSQTYFVELIIIPNNTQYKDTMTQPFSCQCSPHTETSQLIYNTNQLTRSYMKGTLAWKRLDRVSFVWSSLIRFKHLAFVQNTCCPQKISASTILISGTNFQFCIEFFIFKLVKYQFSA